MDKFREECGIFGIFGHPEAANLTYLGLYALQHRGQESVGIATSDGGRLQSRNDHVRTPASRARASVSRAIRTWTASTNWPSRASAPLPFPSASS